MFDPREMEEQASDVLLKAAGADLSMASDDELEHLAIGVERLRTLLDATAGHALGELHARGTTDARYGQRTGAWIARVSRQPTAVANTRVRVGARLRADLPLIDQALVDGRLGFEHARSIVSACNPRILAGIVAIQQHLIDTAQDRTFEVWHAELGSLCRLIDQDGGHDPNTDLHANRMSLFNASDGALLSTGQFHGETAVVIEEVLESETDELFRRFTADAEVDASIVVPSRATLRALALAALCHKARSVDIGSTRAPVPEATWVIHSDEPDLAVTGRGRYLPVLDLGALACCADMHPLVVDGAGRPLYFGRKVRLATPDQRRALAARDGGCVFPGCDAPPAWCDAHHSVTWSGPQHGPTDIDHLALLCRHHHGVTHRRGWEFHMGDDQWCSWTTPEGRTIYGQRRGRQRTSLRT